MTTTVKIVVGGKYRAHVGVSHADGSQEEHIVDGAEGEGKLTVYLRDPAEATITVSEEPIED